MGSSTSPPAFLDGGGNMGALIRAHDWVANELGPPETWPQALQTVVQLMLNTGHPLYIWWGPRGICLYNDAYSQSLGPEQHPGSLGQPAAEVWTEIWSTIGPEIEQVMSGRGPTWHENNLVPITRNGQREDVYWTYSYGPIGDSDAPNGVGGVLVICNETTRQVLAERRVANAAERQQHVFQSAPGFITVLTGPQHVFEFVNTAYTALFGDRDFIGRPVREVFPEIGGQGFLELLDKVYATGEKVTAEALPLVLESDDGQDREILITFIYAPILDDNGAVTGIFCEGMDVTAQARAEEHRRLLTHELQHRVKNMLAVVQAIVNQSLRTAATPAAASAAISGRLVTLGHAHNLLTDSNWSEAPLMAVVEGAVLVHCLAPDRVSVAGPDIHLNARSALAMSMALHELFTNAVKYGALSNEAGKIDIRWQVTDDGVEPMFRLAWRESGGPPVVPPTRTGFGTRLIGAGLKSDLGDNGALSYDAAGVSWILETPMKTVCQAETPR